MPWMSSPNCPLFKKHLQRIKESASNEPYPLVLAAFLHNLFKKRLPMHNPEISLDGKVDNLV